VSDLDDFDLRPPEKGPDEFDETFDPAATSVPRPARSGIHPAVPAAFLVVFVAGLYLAFRPSAPEPVAAPVATPAPTVVATAEPVPSPTPTPLELPALNRSDAFIRRMVAALSANPDFAKWLIPDELARKFVAAVENIAEGEDPMPHLRHLAPARRFQVIGQGRALFADPREFQRFNGFAGAVESIDPGGAARLFLNLRPLFDKAYAELGHPNGGFDRTLERALDRLLATPPSPLRIEVVPGKVNFAFADPRYEALAPAQKMLIRMGPDNRAKVQAKLEEFRTAFSGR